jgi:uncharacterized membrane protein
MKYTMRSKRGLLLGSTLVTTICFCSIQRTGAFTISSGNALHHAPSIAMVHPIPGRSTVTVMPSSQNDNDIETTPPLERSVDPGCWNPTIRKILVVLSSIGAIETGFLSYLKIFDPSGIGKLCGNGEVSSAIQAPSCSSVLNSPYASIQINADTSIPLTVVGFCAYAFVALCSAYPLVAKNDGQAGENNDADNRIAILCATTSMATFSIFLLSLLYNIIHQSCPYCIISASLSLTMAFTSWCTGMLPSNERSEDGAKLALGSLFTTTVAASILFFGVDEASMSAYQNDMLASSGFSNNVVATAKEVAQKDIPPPPVTSKSSEQALKIGEDLKGLNTRFFGAYWCSHCYEQKQRLGKEAMANVQYIECSKEGLNSQSGICKEREVPGYPTWEIGGKLYPGEMYLDELEEIIVKAKSSI